MKDFIKKHKMFIILITISIVIFVGFFFKSNGMEECNEYNLGLGIVNTDYLNMRTGLGIKYKSIDVLTKNEYVRIFRKNW